MLCRANASSVSHVGLDAATASVISFGTAVSPSVRALARPRFSIANRRLHRPFPCTRLLTLPLFARTIGQPVVAFGDQVARAILAHVVLWCPFPYCVAACLGLCALRLEVRSEQASARNKPAAEVALLV